jgi:hypothetical protein
MSYSYGKVPDYKMQTSILVFTFYCRLSRARRCVENAFGILTARWICLARTLLANPERAQIISGACCLLHNFLMNAKSDVYCPAGFADTYDEEGNLINGEWREHVFDSNNLGRQQFGRPSTEATEMREHLSTFFSSPAGELEWQRKIVFLE